MGRKILLACGIASSLVCVLANVLAAIGAPSRSVRVSFGIAYTVLVIAFAVGVWACAQRKRGLRVTAGLLITIGAMGPFWPPIPHVVFARVTSLLMLLAVAFGAATFGERFRRYSIATLAVLVVFGALSFLYAPRLGVIERIDLGGYLLWVVVLAIGLLRAQRTPAPRPAEKPSLIPQSVC